MVVVDDGLPAVENVIFLVPLVVKANGLRQIKRSQGGGHLIRDPLGIALVADGVGRQ